MGYRHRTAARLGDMMSEISAAPEMAANARTIDRELAWLDAVMAVRFAAYGEGGAGEGLPAPPEIETAGGPYADLVGALRLDADERLALVLALAPYVAPALLDPFLLQNQATGRRFTEFGGLTGQSHAGFLPTAETATFLLAGDDRLLRIRLRSLFAPARPLIRRGILVLGPVRAEEPPLAVALRLTSKGLDLLLGGEPGAPNPDLPGRPIATPLDWHDLVLDEEVTRQVEMVATWVAHAAALMEDRQLRRRLRPGYRCLFYGPPGTGKRLTAALLGKRHAVSVWRVDTGADATELRALIDRAGAGNWILLIDADALPHDRAASQQIAYLLQRLEEYPGLVIVASNLRTAMDEAFARRFESVIHFAMPDAAERLRLWRDCFAGDRFRLADDVDLAVLAETYELPGGGIVNVLRYAALTAIAQGSPVIHARDLIAGIQRELAKAEPA